MRYAIPFGAMLLCAVGCAENGSDDDLRLGEPVSETRLEADESEGFGQASEAAEGDRLCAPCASNAACGAGNYCLRRSDGVRFCGRDCRATACPTSYTCTTLSSTVRQCVPPQLECSRVAADAGVRDAGVSDAGVSDAGGGAGVPDAAVASGEVPNTTYCAVAASWDPLWSGYEAEVLRLSNLRRQAGATCGTTSYPPAAPLTMNPALRCAARLHSKDMADKAYFSHTSQDGTSFSQRITRAGYNWRTVGENIASGYRSPQAVVDGWMLSSGHCRNIMNAAFTQIGVGFSGNYLWTQDFGAPL
jgi:uncharacterized protein YkwD